MQISATGKASAKFLSARQGRGNGFTLVELLVVLTIVGLMSAAVVLAMPDGRGSLIAEAERFAARAEAARERAVMDGRPVAILVTRTGYGFERREKGEWKRIGETPSTGYAWSAGTRAGMAAGERRVVFDAAGMSEPLRLLLVRGEEQVLVNIDPGGEVRVVA
jgi:general secretion pathway protein H